MIRINYKMLIGYMEASDMLIGQQVPGCPEEKTSHMQASEGRIHM